jgi:hypothetical protein
LTDIAQLDDGGAHQGALDLYLAVVAIADASEVAFWDAMPLEIRPEALAYIDAAVAKLVKIGVEGRLGRIVRTATPGRRP